MDIIEKTKIQTVTNNKTRVIKSTKKTPSENPPYIVKKNKKTRGTPQSINKESK